VGRALNRFSVVLCVIAGGATPAAAQDASRVRVEYSHPEKFADTGRYWGGETAREVNLAELRNHLQRRAARLLPEDQSLSILVTEVDIAGGFEPWHAKAGHVRVLRAAYPPRIDLSFRLTRSDGSVLQEGERRLRDPFMIGGLLYRGDRLRYEKGLLDDWLESELPARAGE